MRDVVGLSESEEVVYKVFSRLDVSLRLLDRLRACGVSRRRRQWQRRQWRWCAVDRPMSKLSTGEVRKVMLALAMSRKPRVLVLDEPFDGLDRGNTPKAVTVRATFVWGLQRAERSLVSNVVRM